MKLRLRSFYGLSERRGVLVSAGFVRLDSGPCNRIGALIAFGAVNFPLWAQLFGAVSVFSGIVGGWIVLWLL